jgi:hypothetical protein
MFSIWNQSNRIRKLYEPLLVPMLFVGRVEDLRLLPLFPCFLDGKTTSTIQSKYYTAQLKQAFEFACATVKALHHSGAAIFLRSTYGWPQWHSLKLEGFPLQKEKGSRDSPGLQLPGVLGRQGSPVRMLLRRYDTYIPGIYLVYAC